MKEQPVDMGKVSSKEDFYAVGVVAGTHGIRGELRVLPRTDFPEKRFRKLSVLWLRDVGEKPFLQLEVLSARPHKQFWLVVFEGYEDINQVESWRGKELCIPESELEPLPEGSYYIHQLVGLEVVTEEGQLVGNLIEVLQPGANDVYVVRGPLQKREVLLPAIPDVVRAVDLAQKRMTVRLMPGLLESDDGGGDEG